MSIRIFSSCLLALVLSACGGIVSEKSPVGKNLLLNNSQSTLSFVSIKKDSIGEVHRFNGLSGFVTEMQQAQLNVDLLTVSTGIQIRDQRMQKHLFETSKFGSATLLVSLEGYPELALSVGQRTELTLQAELDVHGVRQSMPATVIVVRTKNGGLLVQSSKPIMIDALSFGFKEGISKLAELAALPSIASSVPVSFTLQFDPT